VVDYVVATRLRQVVGIDLDFSLMALPTSAKRLVPPRAGRGGKLPPRAHLGIERTELPIT
jgi:hypothetical protein